MHLQLVGQNPCFRYAFVWLPGEVSDLQELSVCVDQRACEGMFVRVLYFRYEYKLVAIIHI